MDRRVAFVVLMVGISIHRSFVEASSVVGMEDFRIVRQQDLLTSDGSIFEDELGSSYSQLLFDVARNQLVVGARDNLFRLSLRDLKELERATWTAPEDKTRLCQMKGQTETNCHNYVKILLSNGSKLFACGTNAFSPLCSWREIENVSAVIEWVQGIAKCPFNPHSNTTSLLTMSGQYYVGSPTDFSSSDHAIYRTPATGDGGGTTLRTNQYNSKWLNEPQFVGSFEDDKFVYFVFREAAVEYMNCGKKIYSRVARVCKNDAGGQMLLKENWTTFVKARLNCSLPGEYPFYYDEVQGMSYVPEEKMLYATFTTSSNSIAGSAVCAFSMDALHAAFRGPFKHQVNTGSAWERRVVSHHSHFECRTQARSQQLVDSHRYQLMDDAIQPVSSYPIYKADLERFTHISVDITPTKYSTMTHILFVATSEGSVKKLSVNPGFNGSCLVELWTFNRDANGNVDMFENMQYLEATNSIYIGTSKSIFRIPVQRCAQYTKKESCLRWSDPYCGWNERTEVCSAAPGGDASATHWVQAASGCPAINMTVDGGWSAWSDWVVCHQDAKIRDAQDKCLCQTRRCNNPTPSNGGANCEGISVMVTNCTMHGGWTDWSSWSACSASCGVAVKSRRRWCSSPPPAHGGRLCVGSDSQEVFCTGNPPCPMAVSQAPPRDGGWSSWGPWGPCVPVAPARAACGGTGYKERERKCTQPAPARGGAPCEGSDRERLPCELRPCETRKAAAWSPWMHANGNSSDGSYVEKRFKFFCKAQTVEQVKLNIVKEEERFCRSDGACSTTPFASAVGSFSSAEWSGWSDWRPCLDGQQSRTRTCISGRCEGSSIMHRSCQSETCTDCTSCAEIGEWGGWGEWGACSAPCTPIGLSHTRVGWKERQRRRICGNDIATERESCDGGYCQDVNGWSGWSDWSLCVDALGEQSRRRSCLDKIAGCSGPTMQIRDCDQQEVDNELHALPSRREEVQTASFMRAGRSSLAVETGVGIGSFVLGCLCTTIVFLFIIKRDPILSNRFRLNKKTKVPSSPHYITAQQNSYVSVPLKEVPQKKRQPSFNGVCSTSAGIILSKNNLNLANNHNNTAITPKLVPKSLANEYDTLKRNSNSSHQPPRNNIDFEQEKFY